MTLLITYDDTEDLGRVRLSFSGYSALAEYATVERSPDNVNWSLIRGGDKVPVAAGAGHIDDYEFSASVINYYRVTAIDQDSPVYVGVGSAGVGNNASVVPGLPAGTIAGDLKILHAGIRNSGTGTVNLPAGWTALVTSGNMLIAGRVHVGGDTAPTVTFAGGAANEDTIASIVSFRGITMTGATIPTATLNGSAQDISTPGNAFFTNDWTVRFGWKQDDFTALTAAGYTQLYAIAATAGNDAGLGAMGLFRTTSGTDLATTLLATGGAAAISRGATISFRKASFTDQETGTITPAVAYYRLKSPTRPSLNIRITPVSMTDVTRKARTGVFDVVGRTYPVAVSDVQGSRVFTLEVDVIGYSAKEDMDNRLSTGDTLFLQAPAVPGMLPSMYFVAGDVSYAEDSVASGSYTFTIPMTEVAAPAYSVYGITATWQDILNTYATWSALIAAKATWQDVMDIIAASSVIVP